MSFEVTSEIGYHTVVSIDFRRRVGQILISYPIIRRNTDTGGVTSRDTVDVQLLEDCVGSSRPGKGGRENCR